jgi:coiled-coil domain-containing protein 12
VGAGVYPACCDTRKNLSSSPPHDTTHTFNKQKLLHTTDLHPPRTMSTATLDAAAAARKERLSQLKSLKRKAASAAPADSEQLPDAPSPEKDVSHLLSGRNYDAVDRAPKMGFASLPSEGQDTVEARAAEIAAAAKAAEPEDENKTVDVFNLQPRKPNWDLKRDVDKKLALLQGKTDAAIARLVRARIEEGRKPVDGEEPVEKSLAKLVEEREREGDELDGEVGEDE